jgi:hypothetical protein
MRYLTDEKERYLNYRNMVSLRAASSLIIQYTKYLRKKIWTHISHSVRNLTRSKNS